MMGGCHHFNKVLNRPSPTEAPSIPEAPSELELNRERPRGNFLG